MEIGIEEIKTKARINSFWVSLTYVCLGLISLWVLFSDKLGNNDFLFLFIGLIVLLTLPVYILSFPVLWAGGANYSILIATELIIFFIFWYLFYKILFKKIFQPNKR